MSNLPDSKYANSFSENGFWNFIKKFSCKVSEKFLTQIFTLWILATSGKTSVLTKTLVLAALGYAISPIDAIPDVIPVVGLTDDAAVLVATITSVESDITPEIREKAEKDVKELMA